MSHAYVEVRDKGVAGAVLRGEAQLGNGRSGKKERGSVLGKGRRARGVTITRSGQEELMADVRVVSVFPGRCYCSRPETLNWLIVLLTLLGDVVVPELVWDFRWGKAVACGVGWREGD